jgi:hypothetical protein
MRKIAIGSLWLVLAIGACGTGSVLAKDVPASSYLALANFSGFAPGSGPQGPGGGSAATDYAFTSGNGGKFPVDRDWVAGFLAAAR